jgi:hypothetical protein
MANYAWTTGRALPDVENGTIFENENFSRRDPHTAIFAGKTGLVFKNCNLVNCDVPADATVQGGARGHVSRCSNIHPDWVEKGLTACSQNCTHVVSTDTVTIDGVVVDTIYYYSDKGVT